MMKQELNDLNQNRTIPIFDCLYELDDHLEFYTALGFEIIYYQKAPYRFASVKNEFTEISFFGNKNFELDKNGGGCYIVVPNVDEVYTQLKANLKQYYGKIPTQGIPRFSRLNDTAEDRRFNITDPSGNTLIVGQAFEDSSTAMKTEEERMKKASPFEKSFKQAYRFAYSKEDFRAARNTLEYALLKQSEGASSELLFKAKVLQLDVLISLEQVEMAKKLYQDLEAISLSTDEQENLKPEIQRLIELKEGLFVK